MNMPVNVNNMNLFIDRSYNTHINNTSKSIEKLVTAKRVNRAGDDVAALSIAAKADSQIRGSSQVKKNIIGAMGVLDEAATKLSTAFDLISNIRELYVQGLNGTNSRDEVDMIQRQIIEYQRSLDQLSPGSPVGKPDDPTGGLFNKNFQVGANDGEIKNLDFLLNPAQEDDINLNLDSTLFNWGIGGPPPYSGFIGLNEGGNNPLDSIANTALPNTSLSAYKSGGINSMSGLDDIDRAMTNLSRMQTIISAKQSYFQGKYDEVEQKEI